MEKGKEEINSCRRSSRKGTYYGWELEKGREGGIEIESGREKGRERESILYCLHRLYFAELYMVQDKSNDFMDTWDFLETRLGDIKDLNKIYAEVRSKYKMSC